MFKIEYIIIKDQFGGIENITKEVIQYDFLIGDISFSSSGITIDMSWGWIPLLDFAYCLKAIVKSLKANDISKQYFEFTENDENLEFLRERINVRISGSFSKIVLATTMVDFEIAANTFHQSVSDYVRKNISISPPKVLEEYLSH